MLQPKLQALRDSGQILRHQDETNPRINLPQRPEIHGCYETAAAGGKSQGPEPTDLQDRL